MFCKLTKLKWAIIGSIVALGIVALGLGLGLGLTKSEDAQENTSNRRGVVVANGFECAEIGGKILEEGGHAVDAAVATILCEGVALPESTGIGGGFLMTIYDREKNEIVTLNAREVAPAAADENMFDGDPELSSKGGLSVAVPGELRGLQAAHKRYGRLKWEQVVKPTLDLCKNGHYITSYLSTMLEKQEQQLLNSPSLREIFIDPDTEKPYKLGHMLKRPDLAQTLEKIINEPDALHKGSLTKEFVNDIRSQNGIITEEDMANYNAEWLDPIIVDLPNKQKLYTFPLPGSGVILSFIMNLMNGFLDHLQPDLLVNWQRIVESFKYGFGKRTELGDPKYVPGMEFLITNLTDLDYANAIRAEITDDRTFDQPSHYGANTSLIEDHGTAHISVLDTHGNAVAVTSTINLIFGAGIRSLSTGIILNDQMDDFSAPNITNSFGMPPSPNNYIVPGKRPLSSMCPSIIVDGDRNVRLIIGGAGGTKITTSVALVTVNHLWYDMQLHDAMSRKRLHHQLFPMSITFEPEFNQDVVDGLTAIGHDSETGPETDGFAAVVAVAADATGQQVTGAFDPRRGGSVYYVEPLTSQSKLKKLLHYF